MALKKNEIKKKRLKTLAEKVAAATLSDVAKNATKKLKMRKLEKRTTKEYTPITPMESGATIGGALANKVSKPKLPSTGISKKTTSSAGPTPAQKEGRAYTAENPAPKPKAGTKYKTTSGKTGTVYNAPTEQLRKAKKMMNSLN